MPLSGHTEILHTLIGVGCAALTAAVSQLPWFPTRDKKRKEKKKKKNKKRRKKRAGWCLAKVMLLNSRLPMFSALWHSELMSAMWPWFMRIIIINEFSILLIPAEQAHMHIWICLVPVLKSPTWHSGPSRPWPNVSRTHCLQVCFCI